jgi:hypothetical protein
MSKPVESRLPFTHSHVCFPGEKTRLLNPGEAEKLMGEGWRWEEWTMAQDEYPVYVLCPPRVFEVYNGRPLLAYKE